jgi:hypothetical protein
MEIHCKIGTHPSSILRLKRNVKHINKGDHITGVLLHEYNGRYTKWQEYLVDDINDEIIPVFFYLSK